MARMAPLIVNLTNVAAAITATHLKCYRVTVQADKDNIGTVNVGTVTTQVFQLAKRDSVDLYPEYADEICALSSAAVGDKLNVMIYS